MPSNPPAPQDVVVIFPPLWYYLHVPTELASIAAYLRAEGFQTAALDLNIESIVHFLSREYLSQKVMALRREWNLLNAAQVIVPEQQSRLIELGCILPLGDAVVREIDDAMAVFRDSSRFYDLQEHARAQRILVQAWRLISAAHTPTVIDFHRFKTAFDVERLDRCLEAARDESQNPYVEYVREEVLPRILDMTPACIAIIYVHPDQVIPLFTLVVALRASGCVAHVTIAGSLEDQVTFTRYVQARAHPDYKRLFSLIDSVIVYEPERPLAELAGAIRSGGTLEHVPNLLRWEHGTLIGPSRLETANLDALPSPDYAGLPLDRYLFPEPVFALLSSRGCYWDRCTFCAITSNQLRYRTRSVARVVADMQGVQLRHGARWFHFRDMLMSPAYLHRFSTAILNAGLDVRWICRSRFESALTHDILENMVRAGCVEVWFGFESSSPRVLRLMDKGVEICVVKRILDDCFSVHLGVHMLAMHGFPTESSAEAEETVSFLLEHAELIDSVSYTDFLLFRGTPVALRPAEFGVQLTENGAPLLRHQLEHGTPSERERSKAQYRCLDSRLKTRIPSPLLHASYESLYRNRLGPGWKAASTGISKGSDSSRARQGRARWTHPPHWVIATHDARVYPAPRTGCVFLTQIESDRQIQLGLEEGRLLPDLGGRTIEEIHELYLTDRDPTDEGSPSRLFDLLDLLTEQGFIEWGGESLQGPGLGVGSS